MEDVGDPFGGGGRQLAEKRGCNFVCLLLRDAHGGAGVGERLQGPSKDVARVDGVGGVGGVGAGVGGRWRNLGEERLNGAVKGFVHRCHGGRFGGINGLWEMVFVQMSIEQS